MTSIGLIPGSIHPSSRPRWFERTARNHREPGPRAIQCAGSRL